MTVLRSREIVSLIKSQSPLKTLEKGAIEPATPAKTLEPSSHAVCSTTPSSSDSVPVSGLVRRRSLRLALVPSVDAVVPSRKRKSENWMRDKGGDGLKSVGRDGDGFIENGVSDSRAKKARVSDRIRLNNGVPGELSMAVENGVSNKVTNVRVSERIRMKNGVQGELSVAVEGEGKLGTKEGNSDLSRAISVVDVISVGRGVIKYESGVTSEGTEKGERKFGNGANLLSWELVRGGGSGEGFLKLRSGKKVSKGMKGNNGHVDFVGFKRDDVDNSVHVNGVEHEDE